MSVVFSQASPIVWLPITAFIIACAANGVAYLVGYAHGTKNSKIDAVIKAQRAERVERQGFRGRRRRSRDVAPPAALARATFQPAHPATDYGMSETVTLQRIAAGPANSDDFEPLRAVQWGVPTITGQRQGQ